LRSFPHPIPQPIITITTFLPVMVSVAAISNRASAPRLRAAACAPQLPLATATSSVTKVSQTDEFSEFYQV